MTKVVRGERYAETVPLPKMAAYRLDKAWSSARYVCNRDEDPTRYSTHPWQKCFLWWPQVSCLQGWAWGRAMRRMIADDGRYATKPYEFQYEYATKRDVVTLKIKGDPYEKKE